MTGIKDTHKLDTLFLSGSRKDGTRPLKFNQYGNRKINKNSRV